MFIEEISVMEMTKPNTEIMPRLPTIWSNPTELSDEEANGVTLPNHMMSDWLTLCYENASLGSPQTVVCGVWRTIQREQSQWLRPPFSKQVLVPRLLQCIMWPDFIRLVLLQRPVKSGDGQPIAGEEGQT